jgi:hypothetical protein
MGEKNRVLDETKKQKESFEQLMMHYQTPTDFK